MAYQVIALRYRPRRFADVVGQENAAQALRQAVVGGRLAHAYLFAGPRGVGKTSMARILAMALNCAAPVDGEPCGCCRSCTDIMGGADLDVIELDGASNRGIDDVRELIAGAACAPLRGRVKVYIVDEVHMLTREAFNAFLKTLEEPPPHVKFVCATTEPHRIPETVASRLQRFDFRPIGEADVVRRLEQICAHEKASPQEGVLARIAQYAHGGMRDAQTLLDQLITFAGAAPALADLDRVAGRLDRARTDALMAALRGGDPREVWRITREALGGVTSPESFLEQIVLELRDDLAERVRDSGKVPEDALLRIEILTETLGRLRTAPFPEVLVEVTLLRLAACEGLVSIAELLDRTAGAVDAAPQPASAARSVRAPAAHSAAQGAPVAEAATAGKSMPTPAAPASTVPRPATPATAAPAPAAPRPAAPASTVPRPATPASAVPPPAATKPAAESRPLQELWPLLLSELGQKSRRTAEFLRAAVVTEAPGGKIVIEARGETTFKFLGQKTTRERIEQLLRGLGGRLTSLEVRLQAEAGAEAAPTSGAGEIREEPIFRRAREIFGGKPG